MKSVVFNVWATTHFFTLEKLPWFTTNQNVIKRHVFNLILTKWFLPLIYPSSVWKLGLCRCPQSWLAGWNWGRKKAETLFYGVTVTQLTLGGLSVWGQLGETGSFFTAQRTLTHGALVHQGSLVGKQGTGSSYLDCPPPESVFCCSGFLISNKLRDFYFKI